MPEERKEHPVLADKEGVEVIAGPSGRGGQPPGVDVVRPFFKRRYSEALSRKRRRQANRKGSLAGTAAKPGNNYPWY
jgi:hypothetical protein